MKFASTAPITGAMIYRIKLPSPETIFGPKVLAGFMLAPVSSPKKNASIPTIVPTPNASENRLTSLLTNTCIENISSKVIEISIAQEEPRETAGIVAPDTTIIAAAQPPKH
tara:strand:+ start:374 stop:706 length:333 start_codon:yes stop_codon:yes gene_type:complete